MCTAINIFGERHLFGRTLDLECSYGERVVVTPRNFRIDILYGRSFISHLALVGTACVRDGFPLYYDAMNEAGLCVAALNFPKSAVYSAAPREGQSNIASFEFIPWVLCQCESVGEAEELLWKTRVTEDGFSRDMPPSPLHWIVADRHRAITVEPLEDGLKIHENTLGVLTNEPPFLYHLTHLADFVHLSADYPQNRLCKEDIDIYSRGLGAVGLPGDFSSASRFVRAVFLKEHTDRAQNEAEEISRFFHITDGLSVPRGSVKTDNGESVLTVYTSCACSGSLTYYFTTYGCRRIRAIDMRCAKLDGGELVLFDMDCEEDILRL